VRNRTRSNSLLKVAESSAYRCPLWGLGALPIHMQAAEDEGVSRTDAARPLLQSDAHEEATADYRARPRGVAPRALRRDVRNGGRLMFPIAVALPLAFLPIVSLVATLRWMALSSG
jgi:hypothetical protein